ncbi:MAG: nucleoside hydrolase-like domain-containing protein [Bacteroidota bacterium]
MLSLRNVQVGAFALFVSVGLLLIMGMWSSEPVAVSSDGTKPRVVVTTDGEVDDRSSFVRFLLYSSDFDVEGIIATNSVWQKDGHGTGWIMELLDAYRQVRPNLLQHHPDYPDADYLRRQVKLGNEDRTKMHTVGPKNDTPGSRHIIDVLLDDDPRPVWVQAWGGTNTIAQALWRLQQSYTPTQIQQAFAKIRIYAIAAQDSTIWWIRDEVPSVPLVLNGQFMAVNYQHEGHPYSDHAIFSEAWMREHVKEGHGPLGAAYPQAYFSEGDSPSFFHLIDTGLRSTEDLGYGGWGGRFRQVSPAYPNFWRDARDDGDRLKPLWRWLLEIQNDFAARADWSASARYDDANHHPVVQLNHAEDLAVQSGTTVHLDASGTTDPDGDALTYQWWIYKEAGSLTGDVVIAQADAPAATFVAPDVQTPQTIHAILTVHDDGGPSLYRYRRVVVTVTP